MNLVLASQSPRRKELLAVLGIPFSVIPAAIEESPAEGESPEAFVVRVAREKCMEVASRVSHSVILSADTVVAIGNEILGKPADAEEARRMLVRLRGRAHDVVSAVAVMRAGGRAALVRHPVTHVRMRDYDDEEIGSSISRGDPFDKAGAYAIQDELFRPVEDYDGCYCNVVGLSLWATLELLRKADVDVAHVNVGDLLPQCASCPLQPTVYNSPARPH